MTSFKNSHTHVKHNTLVFFLGKLQAIKNCLSLLSILQLFSSCCFFPFLQSKGITNLLLTYFSFFCIGNWDIILLVRLYNLLDPLKDFGWMKNQSHMLKTTKDERTGELRARGKTRYNADTGTRRPRPKGVSFSGPK